MNARLIAGYWFCFMVCWIGVCGARQFGSAPESPVLSNAEGKAQSDAIDFTRTKWDKLRLVYVPYEELNVVLADGVDRILIDRREVLSLLGLEPDKKIPPPRDFVWQRADYEFQINDRVAVIKARLLGYCAVDQGVALPFPWRGVAIQSLQLNGAPATVFWDAGTARERTLSLWLPRSGEYTLELEMAIPLESEVARQRLRGEFPPMVVSSWTVVSPGNVDVVSGATVVARHYDDRRDETIIELAPMQGAFDLVLTINNRRAGGELIWDDSVVAVATLGNAEDVLDVTMVPRVVQGAMQRAAWEIPLAWEVLEVSGDNIRQWSITASGELQTLWIEFQNPIKESAEISVRALHKRMPADEVQWTFPCWRGLGADRFAQVMGMRAPVDWSIRDVQTENLFPLDLADFAALAPARSAASEEVAPLLLAFYAPAGDAQLAVQLRRKPSRLSALASVLFSLNEQEVACFADFAVTATDSGRFDAEFDLPAGFQIQDVQSPAGRVTFRLVGVSQGRQRVAVAWDGAAPSNATVKLLLHSTYVPDGWFAKWATRALSFSPPECVGADETRGVLAVVIGDEFRVAAVEAGELIPLARQDMVQLGLASLDPQFAYEFESLPATIHLELERLPPRWTAQSMTFYRLEPSRRLVHAELAVVVHQASSQRFALQLPPDAAEMIKVATADGRSVAELTRREGVVENIWDVQLDRRIRGPFRLIVDYETSLPDDESFAIPLTPVVLLDADLQTAWVSVEGSPQLDVTAEATAKRESLEMLPTFDYVPGRYLIGIFEVGIPHGSLQVTASRRETSPAPPIVVVNCQMRSELARDGHCQTLAEYQVKSTHPQMLIRLPPKAALWSLVLDKVPQRAQRIGDDVLVVFPRGSSSETVVVQVSYEMPLTTLRWMSEVELLPPQLFLTDGQLRPIGEVPSFEAHWQVRVPPGYRVAEYDADWRNVRAPQPLTWAERNLNWLNEFSLARLQFQKHAPARAEVASETPAGDLNEMAQSVAGEADLPQAMVDHSPAGVLSPNTTAPPPSAAPQTAGLGQGGGGIGADKESRSWADSGLRGIEVQIEEDANAALFQAIGHQPRLKVRIAHQRGLNLLAWALCFVALAIGLLLSRATWPSRFMWIGALLLLALVGVWLEPVLVGSEVVLEKLVWVAVLLAIYFVVVGIGRGLVAFIGRWVRPRRLVATGALICLMTWGNSGMAQNATNAVASDGLSPLPPRVVDDRTVVVPFDMSAWPRIESERWLFPKAWYDRLRAQKELPPPPDVMAGRQFFWSQARYEARADGRTLSVTGWLDLVLPGDAAVDVPLSMAGGSIVSAALDGQPAILIVESPAWARRGASREMASEGQVVMRVAAAGGHQAKLHLEFPLEKISGGFRVAGRMPAALASVLEFTADQRPLTVRWRSGSIDLERSLPTGQPERFQLATSGEFSLEWRETWDSSVALGSANWQAETTLEVASHEIRGEAEFSVQFGEMLSNWQLIIPADVRVERIVGENLQGWVRHADDGTRWNLQLLTAAPSAKVVVNYSKKIPALTEEACLLEMPLCEVAGRGTVTGRVHIVRNDLVSLDVARTEGARRINWSGKPRASETSVNRIPVQRVPFQSFEFTRAGASIELRAHLVKSVFKATHRTAFHIGLLQSHIESTMFVVPETGGIREIEIAVPANVKIDESHWELKAADHHRSIEAHAAVRDEGDWRIWKFRLSQQEKQPVIVTVRASVPLRGATTLAWRGLRVMGARAAEYFYGASSDPALALTLEPIAGVVATSSGELGSWFPRRPADMTLLAARADQSDHRLAFHWKRLPARVKFESITDVTWTRQAVEETMLLEWNIAQSGIEAVEFLLPPRWAEAHINGPLIRRIEKVPADGGWIKVRVSLQDRILGSYRLAVQIDSPLATTWSAALPVNLTGETVQRIVTVQSAGREELVFEPFGDVEPVVRERPLFRALQEKLQSPYLATAYVSLGNEPSTGLTITTVPRETVETVAASIPLSESDVVLDGGGGFLVKQLLRVSNRTEPVLDLVLPDRARLVSVLVDGKPAMPLASGHPRTVRIPLVKSAELDLDYPVVVIYGGSMNADVGAWEIPLAYTQNIETQVSHVRLHVDDLLRPLWFGGTMSRVVSEETLVDEYLDYQSQKLKSISRKMKSMEGKAAISFEGLAQRMDDLSGELSQQAGKRMNQWQMSRNLELQRELTELNEQAANVFQEPALFNPNRAQINGLVANQYLYNEKRWADRDQQASQTGRGQALPDFSQEQFGQVAMAFQNSIGNTNLRGWGEPDLSGQDQERMPRRRIPGDGNAGSTELGDWSRAASAREGRLVGGLELDIVTRGTTYYFRVPRGKPQLTMRAIRVETEARVRSTLQIAGLFVVLAAFALIVSRFRRKVKHRS